MKYLLCISALIFLLPTLALGGEHYEWKQKLTVRVQTPSGIVSGSSVLGVKTFFASGWELMGNGGHYDVRGEAVVVEVAPKKYLFVLLKGLPTAYKVFFNTAFPSLKSKEVSPGLKKSRLSRELTPREYPMLVTFGDTVDPASVKEVQPDNLTKAFGPGVTLASITLSITDEPMTQGKIEAVLGWLKQIGQKRPTLIPNPPELQKDAVNPDIQYLTPGPFSTELYK